MAAPFPKHQVGDKVKNYVIKNVLGIKKHHRQYEVYCICGKILVLSSEQLRNKQSCGCLFNKPKTTSKIVGKRVNNITITKRLDKRGRNYFYEYVCDCGNIGEIKSDKIVIKKNCGYCKRKFLDYEEVTTAYMNSLNGSAKSRNIKFEITAEDIWDQYIKQNKVCALSGQKISFIRGKNIKQTASVDRIDSSKGYTKDNIQILHKHVNCMKMAFSQEDFVKTCMLIAKFKGQDYEKDN